MESTTTLVPDDAPVPRYATFTRRMRAMVLDVALILGAIAVTMIGADALRDVPGSGRVAWVLLIAALFFYEPVLVWRRGATVGHAANHLVVTDTRTGRPPAFGRAMMRYLLKTVLGAPSFVAMALTRRHQTIHDLVTGVAVMVADDHEAEPDDYHLERVDDVSTLPGAGRRVLAIVVFEIALLIGWLTALGAALPAACLAGEHCATVDVVVSRVLGFAWLAGAAAIVVAGWRGRLPGARRHDAATPAEIVE